MRCSRDTGAGTVELERGAFDALGFILLLEVDKIRVGLYLPCLSIAQIKLLAH